MSDAINNIPEKALLWRCRRGTRELDSQLMLFVEKRYNSLSKKEKSSFFRLLESEDPQLNDWLNGQGVPQDKGLANIVEQIRANAVFPA